MRKRILLATGLVLCISLSSLAGEFLINQRIAYGVRVTFSEPVTITQFGDVFPSVTPEGEATEFLFYGAKLPAWIGHGLLWTPSSARILDYDWLSVPPPDPTGDEPETPGVPQSDPVLEAEPIPEQPTPEPDVPTDVPADVLSLGLQDWAGVPYVVSYDRGHNDLAAVYRGGEAVGVDQATHWGLPGSEIKGLKISSADEGIVILLETWDATIRAKYDYGIVFRPQSLNYEAFSIVVDPIDERVTAETETDLDLSLHVQIVSVDDASIVLFMEDVLLPGGASVLSTERLWTRFLMAYPREARNESYELARYLDFET